MAPIPHGEITKSEIWTGESKPEQTFKVTSTYKVRRVTEVVAASKEEAEDQVTKDIQEHYTTKRADYLISEYNVEVGSPLL